jgi:small subunit ribosomal protein S8
MSQTDPISDFLTRMRNALQARHDKIDLPSSAMKVEVARLLKEEGYVRNFKVLENRFAGTLRVYLKYDQSGESVIGGLQRVSRPGRRVYRPADDIPEVLGGLGISIVSTSRGLMTGRQAKREGVGGEIVCKVW